jgi:hypothetical protein
MGLVFQERRAPGKNEAETVQFLNQKSKMPEGSMTFSDGYSDG